MAVIYKIFRRSEYDAFREAGQSLGAPIDLSDGFIHFSSRDQVAETAAKHFAGATDLVLLAVEADSLGDALKWEVSRGGALFPHLYRALRLDDVISARDIPMQGSAHNFSALGL